MLFSLVISWSCAQTKRCYPSRIGNSFKHHPALAEEFAIYAVYYLRGTL